MAAAVSIRKYRQWQNWIAPGIPNLGLKFNAPGLFDVSWLIPEQRPKASHMNAGDRTCPRYDDR